MKQLKKGSREEKKSKQELQQELTEAQEIIENQEDQLEKCAKELQELKEQLGDHEKLQAKLTSAEKQLNSLKDFEKLNDDLKKQLQNSEQQASKQMEKIKKELQASNKEKSELLEAIDKHQNEIKSLKSQIEEGEAYDKAVAESLPTSKSTFRIDIYPYQGHYQGKIEHLLSKAKKPFKGLGENAIEEFISRHLPTQDENHKEAKSGIAFEIDLEKSDIAATTAKIPYLSGLKIIRADTELPCNTLYHDQSFEVQADVDLADFDLDIKGPVKHQITVYANSLEGKPRYTLAEAKGIISSFEESTIKMLGKAPPEGTYRLDAFVALSSSQGPSQKKPIRSSYSGELFHVY
ncbi:MAG: hypothetical protein PVG70_18060 [Desulfobacterales bacterium]|jgi:hypothetical protein